MNELTTPVHVCLHGKDAWRTCPDCLDEIEMKLMIAHRYLKEIAEGKFNDNGIMSIPVSEPIQGRSFQQIAETALMALA